MERPFKDTPIFCRNCGHSIDYHNPERVSLVCFFQECPCQDYMDHEDLILLEEQKLKNKMNVSRNDKDGNFSRDRSRHQNVN